jgi:hypothetical protein
VTSANVSCTTPAVTITANAGAGGTISPSGQVSVPSGTSKTFTVTPNTGYKTASVTGCGGSWVNGSTSYTTGPVTAACAVAASFTSMASTTYTVGGTISGLNGSLSLKLDGTNPTSMQMRTFTANGSYTFASSLPSGSGWTLSVMMQPLGQSCTVSNGSGSGVSGNVTNANVTCSVRIITASSHAYTGGTISPATAQVRSGETQTFMITPNAGYYINSITGCSGATFTGNSSNVMARNYTTGAVTVDCTVSATFGTTTTYNVSGYAYAGGTISPPSAQVRSGATQMFTVTPNAGRYIASISGCNGTVFSGSNTTARNYTTGPISGNCVVYASFGTLSR